MPNWLYNGGMQNVCPSSGTIGTISLPKLASRISVDISDTQASVVDWLFPATVPLSSLAKLSGLGGLQGVKPALRDGWKPPSSDRRSRRYFISGVSSAGR